MVEEPARHKASTGQKDKAGGDVSSSTNKAKNPVRVEAAYSDDTNPDPAVFEAAFKQDDESEGASRASTPKPAAAAKTNGGNDSANTEKKDPAQSQDDDVSKAANTDTPEEPAESAAAPSKQPPQHELPPEVRVKLRRLARLEPSYKGKDAFTFSLIYLGSDLIRIFPQNLCAHTGSPTLESLHLSSHFESIRR